jgi:hypothetical protein
MRLLALVATIGLVGVACGDSGGGESTDAQLSHRFPPVLIEPGEEDLGKCQSWTLENDEPLYVNKVTQHNDGAWHHSNWFFVPETMYDVPDGTWDCEEHGFREYLAAAAGGVFFAQSTQAFSETQAFPEGAVLEIPPRSKIVGDIHLVNVSAATLDSAISFDVDTVSEEDVQVRLRPISFSNSSLAIRPRAESRFSMSCDLSEPFENLGGLPEYNIYYVLAHYHEWGNFFNLSFVHEDGRERTIIELDNGVGEPLGLTLDPPIPSQGATGLRVTCGYDNDTDRTLEYGFKDQEMCVFLAYTDADAKVGIGSAEDQDMGPNEDGIFMHETECGSVVAFPATD